MIKKTYLKGYLCLRFQEQKISDLESKDEMTSQDEAKDGDTPRKKKTRKRTAKERSKAKSNLTKNEAPRGALWGLQVLSKSEWKALRNKYLNLQRKYMREMKMNIHNKKHQYSSIPAPAAPSVVAETGRFTTTSKVLVYSLPSSCGRDTPSMEFYL